jgi:hypothetical protein
MDARLRELEGVEEDVGVFVPWELILRCAANRCGVGLENEACDCTDEGFARHCS